MSSAIAAGRVIALERPIDQVRQLGLVVMPLEGPADHVLVRRGPDRTDEVRRRPDVGLVDRDHGDVHADPGVEQALELRRDVGRHRALARGQPLAIGRRQVLGFASVVPEAEHEVERRADVPVDPERGRAARQVANGRPGLRGLGGSLAHDSGRWSGCHRWSCDLLTPVR
jgi:hypothetical protein